MSMDVNQPAQPTTTVTTVTNVTPAIGGLVGQTEQALASQPTALLFGTGVVLAYLAVLFAVVLFVALSGNKIAQSYLNSVFSASGLWVAIAVILVGAAYVAPSPVARAK